MLNKCRLLLLQLFLWYSHGVISPALVQFLPDVIDTLCSLFLTVFCSLDLEAFCSIDLEAFCSLDLDTLCSLFLNALCSLDLDVLFFLDLDALRSLDLDALCSLDLEKPRFLDPLLCENPCLRIVISGQRRVKNNTRLLTNKNFKKALL